jgi:hypothetical protein
LLLRKNRLFKSIPVSIIAISGRFGALNGKMFLALSVCNGHPYNPFLSILVFVNWDISDGFKFVIVVAMVQKKTTASNIIVFL